MDAVQQQGGQAAGSKSTLAGYSLLGATKPDVGGAGFRGVNPATGEQLAPVYSTATQADLSRATALAASAAPIFAGVSAGARAAFLRVIAEELIADGEAIIARAQLESGLPLGRLQGELARTAGQFRLFADLIEDGLWVDARIDEAMPDRKPLPRADIRSMLRPIGPVAVFGASNFPLAFSVAGGDTASALAAGNPVLVKAHPAHPGTSELAGRAIQRAVDRCELPDGIFALLFDAGIEVGQALVQHPAVKAVGFTGSAAAGQALMRLCADRPEPIPCFAEMGSTNPLFILPGALHERGEAIAQGLAASFSLGSGQMCTKPGIVFLPYAESSEFLAAFKTAAGALAPQQMLTPGIARKYLTAIDDRLVEGDAQCLLRNPAPTGPGATASAAVFSVSLEEYLASPGLEEEIFGPTTLLVQYDQVADLAAAGAKLHGQLTASIHAAESDLGTASELARILETRAGRIVFNGYPTGVEVCSAMVHGGPFPATSDGRSTSVGTGAILRFARPVSFQNYPDAILPAELQRSNPLGIQRLVNGALTREPQTKQP